MGNQLKLKQNFQKQTKTLISKCQASESI